MLQRPYDIHRRVLLSLGWRRVLVRTAIMQSTSGLQQSERGNTSKLNGDTPFKWVFL